MRTVVRPGAAAIGVALDGLCGEPPVTPHPVSVFGGIMRGIERRLYRPDRAAGARHAAIGTLLGATAGGVVRSTAVATYVAVAGRSLRDTAAQIGVRLDAGDLAGARAALPSLVGRDPTDLDGKEIARAVVESVAENTVDAVVAPALWAAALGAPGALGYRAINTMDAMVGHRSPRYQQYGWAAARLDDAANWVPARAAAALVALVRPRRAGTVLAVVRRDGRSHPSPNAGVAEAAFAAALDLRLGGVNRYGDRTELRPSLGDGRPPEPADIGRAIALSRDVTVALAMVLIGIEVAR